MHYNDVDWEKRYENCKKALKEELESNPKMWHNFTTTDKRYTLISILHVCESNFDQRHGAVTHFLDTFISSNAIEILEQVWASDFYQRRYENTTQHLIVDNVEKRVVKILSACM